MIDTPCGNELLGEMAEELQFGLTHPALSFRCSGGRISEGAVSGVFQAIIRHKSAAFSMRRQFRMGHAPGFLGISTNGRLWE